ncbi:MAG: PIN domain-containing protein [Chthoniobacteraceae bacterium]
MKYLLDANVLISLGIEEHVFHFPIVRWLESLKTSEDELVSCSITELAFVRILSQLPGAGITIADAKHQLAEMKADSRLRFSLLTDALGADKLPTWVKSAKQTTDGHLAELAKANGAVLATLDGKIPGSFVIPVGI